MDGSEKRGNKCFNFLSSEYVSVPVKASHFIYMPYFILSQIFR